MIFRFDLTYICFITLIISSVLCSSGDYVKLGQEMPPLPDSAKVEVFTGESPSKDFILIGKVTVIHDEQSERVEQAKSKAKQKGGNAIISKKAEPYNAGTDIRQVVDPSKPGGFRNLYKQQKSTKQEFIIIRLK